MSNQNTVNMERSYAFYAGGLGLVMVLSLVLNNVPEIALSRFVEIPHKKQIGAALFMAGSSMGGWAVHLHMLRSKKPWAIPQSQISWPYIGFLICSLAALAVTH